MWIGSDVVGHGIPWNPVPKLSVKEFRVFVMEEERGR
jgi:hypothetical protein